MISSLVRRLDRRFIQERSFEPDARHVRASLLVAAACGAFILSLAIRMGGPTVHPDEFGFLTNGQALIGHVEAQIPTGSFYPAGYGVITGLGAMVTGSISGAYRFALVSNVLLALTTALLAARLASRVFGASRGMSAIAGALVLVTPGTIVTSLFAWPETLSRLLFLALIYLVMTTAKNPVGSRLWVTALYTGLMPAVHGRFTLVLPIVCLMFLWWGRTRVISRWWAISACVVTSFGYVGSYLLNRFVKQALYLQSYDQENRLLRRLIDPTLWPALLRTMTGQTWYLVGTTFGLAAVAIAFAVSRIISSGGVRTLVHDTERTGLAMLVLSTIAIIFTGGLQLLYGDRGDHLIYGRYVEIVVPALLVVACVAFERRSALAQRAWIVGGLSVMAISMVYVLVDMGDGVKGGYSRGAIVFPNIIGTDILRYLVRPGLLTFGALITCVTMALWMLGRRTGAWAIVVLVALVGAGSAYSGQRSILPRPRDLVAENPTADSLISSGAEIIGFDQGVRNDRSYYFLRYKLHPIKLVRFDVSSPVASIPGSMNCVYAFPDRPPSDGDWVVVSEDAVLQRVLWKRTDAPHC